MLHSPEQSIPKGLFPPQRYWVPRYSRAAPVRARRSANDSSNVITQARDLEVLRERGYRLTRVAPVDMFPHTKHVESVVTLERR